MLSLSKLNDDDDDDDDDDDADDDDKNPPTGHFSRRVRENGSYFTHLSRRFLTTDLHRFWVTCSSRGRSQLCKVFNHNLLTVKGFGVCGG